ncbi:hypothetical protein T439DRAFT_115524 [Meredithblackwellia eburnea MCA 4105]
MCNLQNSRTLKRLRKNPLRPLVRQSIDQALPHLRRLQPFNNLDICRFCLPHQPVSEVRLECRKGRLEPLELAFVQGHKVVVVVTISSHLNILIYPNKFPYFTSNYPEYILLDLLEKVLGSEDINAPLASDPFPPSSTASRRYQRTQSSEKRRLLVSPLR